MSAPGELCCAVTSPNLNYESAITPQTTDSQPRVTAQPYPFQLLGWEYKLQPLRKSFLSIQHIVPAKHDDNKAQSFNNSHYMQSVMTT